MPLVLLKNIDEHCRWGLWKISEPLEVLRAQLNPGQLGIDFLNEIHHPTKQQESIAARLVVKKILESWEERYQGISKDDCSKPWLVGCPYYVSISHAKGYAIAMIHQTHTVGIDIEPPRAKLQRIAQKFLSPPELEHAQQDLNTLAIYWVAKEAMYKMYGKKKLSLRHDIAIDRFKPMPEGVLQAYFVHEPEQPIAHKVYYFSYQGYFIAYAL